MSLMHPAAMDLLTVLKEITPEGQALRDIYPDIEIDNEECTAPLEVTLRKWEAAGFPFYKEPENDEELVDLSIRLLRVVRDLLKEAKCPRATDKVRSAIRSAEGAQRNVANRPYREQE